MAVLRIGGQEVRSRWARADGAPSWSEKLMLCWDGGMPLNIDMYGGKEHIGQVRVNVLCVCVCHRPLNDGLHPTTVGTLCGRCDQPGGSWLVVSQGGVKEEG